MIVYAYLFERSKSGREFILIPDRDDFSAIPKRIAS
jgi:hypothetical protein